MRLSTGLLTTGCLLSCAHALPRAVNTPARRDVSRVKFRSVTRSTAPKINVLAATGDTSIDLNSSQDIVYIADIKVGGTDYIAQLDTGSSDLWLHTNGLNNIQYTPFDIELTFGAGSCSGSVVRGEVQFAGFTVPDQALLDAIMADNAVLQHGAVGVVGLGFTRLSTIDSTVNNTGAAWGRSLLYNVFAQDASVPNYITFLLSRSNDPEAAQEGSFTISETENGYGAVTSQPRISTWPRNGPARWNIIIDGFAANGKRYQIGTTVRGVSGSRSVVLLDSGTSYTYAPDTVVNALYGDIEGARYSSSSQQWNIPCTARVEMVLFIGGQQYNIHPLDMVIPNPSNPGSCIGSFVPMSQPLAPGEIDWLIGVNVLRSFYTLYDFGDPVHNAPEGNSPTVQILQLRTAAQARQDFFNVRGGDPPTNTQSSTGTTSGGSTNSDGSTSGPQPTGTNGDGGDGNSGDGNGDNGEQTFQDGGSTVTDQQSTDGSGGKGTGAGPSHNGLESLSQSARHSISIVVDYMPAVFGILGANVAVLIGLFLAGIYWMVRRRRAAHRPSALSLANNDYKTRAINDPLMSEQVPVPTTPLTPTAPTTQTPFINGQAPAPTYDSSSLPMRRGLRPPAPVDPADGRFSSAY